MQDPIVGVIPARMGSSRFPGKPLAPLLGQPMIEQVRRRAEMCPELSVVYVATCDEAIKNVVEAAGGRVIMTSPTHECATDRVAEAAEQLQAGIVVMIQGDEPMITPAMITAAVNPLLVDRSVECINLVHRLTNRHDYLDRNTIKVVMNLNHDALYFSRAAIPVLDFAEANQAPVFKQVCVIPFRTEFLREFARMPPTPLERAESIDMLRIIEHGRRVRLAFNLAARKCGIPLVLITHGMPIRPVARLSFDLAVVHCEAARRVYNDEDCRISDVLTHGRRQVHGPMPAQLPERLTVGIFLCKDVNDKRLQALVTQLLAEPNVSSIRIRPHPKNLWVALEGWVAAQHEPRLAVRLGAPVFEDIQLVDVVLAGNSSVLIDAVTAGRPSGYIVDIDHGPPDLHCFVQSGLIYPLADEWSPNSMLRFYQRPGWLNVLRLFANIDENDETVAMKAAVKMRRLVNP